MVKDIYVASFAQVHDASYFHYIIGFETLGFQAWFGIANLNLWKNRAEFGQRRPNIFMNNSAKNHTAKTQHFKIFHDFFLAVQLPLFHVFWEFKPCLSYIPITMSQNHLWMRSIVWGWKPVRFPKILLICRKHDIMGKFFLIFLNYTSPYPCHSINWFQYHWTSIFCAKCVGLFL